MGHFISGIIVGGIGAGVLVWIFKEPVLLWYKGAEDRIGELNDRIRKIRERL